MTVELQSVGVSPGADSTDCVIVKPAGLSVGWLMLAHTHFREALTTVTPPANWTKIREILPEVSNNSTTFFWKIADGGDVAADDFTFTGSENISNFGAISAWTGHDPTNPINAENGQENGYEATVTAPTITPSVANCAILLFSSCGNDLTCNGYAIADDDPGGWAEAYDIQYNDGSDTAIAMAYVIRPETTATGNGTATLSASAQNNGELVAIAPAAAPPEEERHQTPHCGPKKLRTQWLSTMRM